MEFINKPETALQSLTISQAKLAIPATFGKLFDEYEYNREGHSQIDNIDYDVYKVTADGKEYTFYEDISAFYGRGNIIPHLWERDIPNPEKLYSLDFIFGDYIKEHREYAIKLGLNIDKIKIRFKKYASNMVSNYIACLYPERNEIDVTPVKEYNKTYDYPILHSFNLYKLFVLHQFIHCIYFDDFYSTEIEIIGNYYESKIGIECTSFTPITKRSFANEFINYMFWLHKPNAFREEFERAAFSSCAKYGIDSRLFTPDELIDSINHARPDDETFQLLTDIIKSIK